MIKRKSQRTHGKIQFSRYFQEFKNGDTVAVIRELAMHPKFPKQLQGRSGVIEGKRGTHYMIRIKDLNKEKVYIIHPVHLKKLIITK
jgi:ribosomal protein L21E